jgi:hypothetical protein
LRTIPLAFVAKTKPASSKETIQILMKDEEALEENKGVVSFKFDSQPIDDVAQNNMFDSHVGDHLSVFYESNFQSATFVSSGEFGKKENFLERILNYIREAEKKMMNGEQDDQDIVVVPLPNETIEKFFNEMLSRPLFVENLKSEIWKMGYTYSTKGISTDAMEWEIICASNTFDFGKEFQTQDAVEQIIHMFRDHFYLEFELFRFLKDHSEGKKNWKARYPEKSTPESPFDFISKFILQEQQ